MLAAQLSHRALLPPRHSLSWMKQSCQALLEQPQDCWM